MAAFDLVSPKKALFKAVAEQLAPYGEVAHRETEAAARAAWRESSPAFVLWDETFGGDALLEALSDSEPPPFVFWYGDPLDDEAAANAVVTETLPRPLRLGALLARIQFYQQARKRMEREPRDLGPFAFRPVERLLTLRDTGAVLRLTDKEAALLDYLVQADAPRTKEDILAAVWGYEEGTDTHTLETHIYKLRRKLTEALEERGADANDIFSVGEGGYALNPSWLKSV